MPSSPRALPRGPLACVAAGIFLAAQTASEAEVRWGGSVALTTDYLLRGVSQTDGSPAVQAELHFQTQTGWLGGLWASNVEVNPEDGRTAELNAFFGYSHPIAGEWSMKLVAVHYAYPGNSPADFYNYDELIAGAAFRDVFFVTATISPNTPHEADPGVARDHTAVSYELALRYPLQGTWSALGGVGYYDLKAPDTAGYAYWSAGVGYDFEPWHLEIAWFGTGHAAAALFDEDRPSNRLAATLIWRF
jgi:uncharacterized protein (TIGR02001 family)